MQVGLLGCSEEGNQTGDNDRIRLTVAMKTLEIREEEKILGYCRACGERWKSKRLCHCTACHRNFGGISGFDAHRRGGQCLDPEKLGMSKKDRVWVTESRFALRNASI